ncbi:CPBP family intramembrane glutamic endopeptidase [Sphingobacterium sp. UBA6645]|uniref:CPBP family intramembrane glutamic endopeptidase n=1 Tax=Sphingobacterium sp. UBA6645 TaxID=1947511 RepID=UPI0025ED6874|nr:CPBP family intramembrane glutamic endopeptidase [Sphingobacterium sp. UBA6645]
MLKILQHFWSFVLHPSDRKLIAYQTDTYSKVFSTLFLFKVLILAIILPLQYLVQYLDPVFTKKSDTDEQAIFYMISAVVFAPLIEEFIFRYFLKYKRYYRFVISHNTYRKNYRWLLYSSVFLYGLAHLFNFENANLLFYFLGVLLVSSNLVDGLVFSFIRVRLGFVYSWAFYGIWNLFIFSLIGTIILLKNPVTKIHNDNIDLEINVSQFRDTTQALFFVRENSDSLFNLNVRQYPLSQVIDSLYGPNRYQVDDEYIDIEMRSAKGYSKDSLMNLLKEDFTIEPNIP